VGVGDLPPPVPTTSITFQEASFEDVSVNRIVHTGTLLRRNKRYFKIVANSECLGTIVKCIHEKKFRADKMLAITI
jgi:hypothetical protein